MWTPELPVLLLLLLQCCLHQLYPPPHSWNNAGAPSLTRSVQPHSCSTLLATTATNFLHTASICPNAICTSILSTTSTSCTSSSYECSTFSCCMLRTPVSNYSSRVLWALWHYCWRRSKTCKSGVQTGGGGVWGIEKLDQEEWQTWAGFVKLRWDEFLDQHKQFWVDVGLGLWDNPT